MILTKTGFDQMQISFIKNRMGSDRKKKHYPIISAIDSVSWGQFYI